ncbi:MAG: S8 family serine peptidase [Nonomuraea sp.]|nr:S8 family serine peptidase [Nonomuraea sp.]
MLLSTAPAIAAPSQTMAAPAAEQQRAVTLVTGDQVFVQGSTSRSVRPAKGREGTAFRTFTLDDHVYVIPADAERLVATGAVDRRLFDVTTLLDLGYDDAHSTALPLIVSHPAGRMIGQSHIAPASVTRELRSIDAVAISADKRQTGAVWDALTKGDGVRTLEGSVTRVWLDGKRRAVLDRSVKQIGAPAAWAAGLTGAGVKVAVLDTGVDQTHPDLADREIAERNFSDSADNVDRVGHGTHVASTVGGTGAASGGRYRGVAYGASILDGKVLDDYGSGPDSSIIAGMEWAAEQGADIVNMSLGGYDTPGLDPMEEAVNRLSQKYGTLFVIAAGNSGPAGETVASPGSAAAALTVGAVDRDDVLAEFSSRGPTIGDGAIKPDVTAPGVGIVAAAHAGGTIGEPVEEGYTRLSGTSMATPHVAGAAALLAQKHPDWTGERLKAVLSGSASPHPKATAFEQGAGRIAVAAALTRTVISEPVSLGLGTQRWPYDAQEPITRTLTYRNLGDSPVTLALSVDATAPDGTPAEVFSLSATTVTVPASGQAQVTVTGDARRGTADGVYSGAVLATTGDSVTRTPIAVHREPESYDLTLAYLDENGAPTPEYAGVLLGLDSSYAGFPYDADGTVTTRLPKGRYLVDGTVYTHAGNRANLIVHPDVVLDRDLSFTMDPRIGKPVNVVPPASARLELGDIGYAIQSRTRLFGSGLLIDDLNVLTVAQLGRPHKGDILTGKVNTQWAGAGGETYGLAWFPAGTVPAGFTKTVLKRDLATVHAEFGTTTKGHIGRRSASPFPASGTAFVWSLLSDVPLPGARTEHYSTDDTIWTGFVNQADTDGGIHATWTAPAQTYRAGHRYTARYIDAVYGPGAAASKNATLALRRDDTISIDLPMFTDGNGNAGFSRTDRATTTLSYNGKLVGEIAAPASGTFENVPPEPGVYRLATSVVRADAFDLSTRIDAEWTFRSAHVGGDQPAALDVIFLRFLPRLEADDSAKAGRVQLVPLHLQDQRGATLRPKRLTAEVSYDEGKTWRQVPIVPAQMAKLSHPKNASTVSLRASATDADGNTVKETVIRAYKLRP